MTDTNKILKSLFIAFAPIEVLQAYYGTHKMQPPAPPMKEDIANVTKLNQ